MYLKNKEEHNENVRERHDTSVSFEHQLASLSLEVIYSTSHSLQGHMPSPLANRQTSLATQSSAQLRPGSLDREVGLVCSHVCQASLM